MKAPKRDKPATEEPLEDRFYRFANALIAVPKKKLDKELTKEEHRGTKNRKRRQAHE